MSRRAAALGRRGLQKKQTSEKPAKPRGGKKRETEQRGRKGGGSIKKKRVYP